MADKAAAKQLSRPARGAWVEISTTHTTTATSTSRPARGAWVEIGKEAKPWMLSRCRAPQGARGLKFRLAAVLAGRGDRRAPQGARGLKYRRFLLSSDLIVSRPARGAWVEMILGIDIEPCSKSRPARGAWVEIRSERDVLPLHHRRAPHGARGLKFVVLVFVTTVTWVAPRKGRVG